MKKLLILSLAFCVTFFAGITGLPVSAQNDTRPAAAGDSVLRIPACAFDEYKDGYHFRRSTILDVTSGSGIFFATVNLPQGSRIKKIKMICWDTNGSAYAKLGFYRNYHVEGGYNYGELIASVMSSDTSSYKTFSDLVTSGSRYVNNEKYCYVLRLDLNAYNIWVQHAQLVYTPPSP